jgi:hypothetical protein
MVPYAIHFVTLVIRESLLYVGRFVQVVLEMMALSVLKPPMKVSVLAPLWVQSSVHVQSTPTQELLESLWYALTPRIPMLVFATLSVGQTTMASDQYVGEPAPNLQR